MNELSALACTLGDLFAESPVVRRVTDDVQTSQRMGATAPHAHILTMISLSGPFPAQPLLLGWWIGLLPQARQLKKLPSAAPFLADAPRVSDSFLTTIEWLRSWLPGYPISFQLPYVDPLAPRVVRLGVMDMRLPWSLELRRKGLQFKPDVSDNIGEVLEIAPSKLRPVLLELRRALWNSETWNAYAEARSRLDESDGTHLKALVMKFREQARAAGVGLERLMSFGASLRAVLRDAEENALLDDRVAAYYRGFRGIDRTLENIGALISQFATREGLHSARPDRGVWINDEELQVRFVLTNQPFLPRLNGIVHLESDISWLRRLVRIEGITVQFDQRLGEQSLATAVTVEHGSYPSHETTLPAESCAMLAQILRDP